MPTVSEQGKFRPASASVSVQDDQEMFNIKLIGGDLTSSLKHINITITIFGKSSKGKSIPRDGPT